jgi:hypothetical protein
MYMETLLTNHQDVAEPDQVASGVAGTGLKQDIDTGISEYPYVKNHGEFFSCGGYRRIVAPEKDPGGSGTSPAPGQHVSTTSDHLGPDAGPAPSGNEPAEKKNRTVIGLGLFSQGGIHPFVQDPVPAIPDKGRKARVPGNRSPAAAAPGPDRDKNPGDFVFMICEREERIADRLTRKIDRLDRRLTRLKEGKPAKPEERRRNRPGERRQS